MQILLGSDHRGIDSALLLRDKLEREGHTVALIAPEPGTACDYPEPAYAVGTAVVRGDAELGVLVCGTGIGMSIAANKVHGVRAALVHDELTAQLSKSHNNANIICLSADLLGQKSMEQIVDVVLRTPFEGGRHQRRLDKITAIETGSTPAETPSTS